MNEASVLAPPARRLAELVGELADLPGLVDDDAARIDVIAGLERLRAAAAAQARVIEQFAVSQEAANRGLGFEARAARRGIPEQVALARRVSPASASRQVTQAKTLVRDLPRTLGLLQTGQISELMTTLVVNETSVLSAADRRAADERITARLPGLGVKQAVAVARRMVIELDQPAVVARAAKARQDRRVSCRPAPDTMAVLSAMLPCEDGVRAYATLRAHADTLKTGGDPRSRDQIMADTLVERLTGQAVATGGPVEIGLIITDTTLFGDADTAGWQTASVPISSRRLPAAAAAPDPPAQPPSLCRRGPPRPLVTVWSGRVVTDPTQVRGGLSLARRCWSITSCQSCPPSAIPD